MRLIRCIVINFSVALLFSSALPQLKDPIFGIRYNSAMVAFEPAPASLYKVCPSLRNERWDRKAWIFAQSDGADGRYIVIGGYYLKSEAIEVDPNGAVVRVQGDHCKLMGAARDVFDYPPKDVSPERLKELAHDAVCRYSRAFGGYGKFADAMRREHIGVEQPHSTVLRDAVAGLANRCAVR